MFKRSRKKKYEFDTTREGFKRLGLNLTERQFEDICTINSMMVAEAINGEIRQPAYFVILIMKTLGLLYVEKPGDELVDVITENAEKVWDKKFEDRFGQIKERRF